MAGDFDAGGLPLGGMQSNSGNQDRASMAVLARRTFGMVAEHRSGQSEESYWRSRHSGASLKGLRGFAAIAENAAKGAYGFSGPVARSGVKALARRYSQL
jgi:hypothetical protein